MKRRLALLLACVCSLGLVQAASADSTRVTELGEYSDSPFPNASCPAPPSSPGQCFVIARATGITMQIGSHHSPFRAHVFGNVVAFTLNLSKPSTTEIDYFRTTFGAPKTANTPGGDDPQVRLAVLKPLHTKQRFELERQSDVYDVNNYLGSTVTIALRAPLRMKKDELLGLTVPTWLPALGHPLDSKQAWRASFRDSECNPPAGKLRPPRAHQKVGTYKQYGCFFRFERLLYSATFVKDPAKTNSPK